MTLTQEEGILLDDQIRRLYNLAESNVYFVRLDTKNSMGNIEIEPQGYYIGSFASKRFNNKRNKLLTILGHLWILPFNK